MNGLSRLKGSLDRCGFWIGERDASVTVLLRSGGTCPCGLRANWERPAWHAYSLARLTDWYPYRRIAETTDLRPSFGTMSRCSLAFCWIDKPPTSSFCTKKRKLEWHLCMHLPWNPLHRWVMSRETNNAYLPTLRSTLNYCCAFWLRSPLRLVTVSRGCGSLSLSYPPGVSHFLPYLVILVQVINISCADAVASYTAVKELHGDPASSYEEGEKVSCYSDTFLVHRMFIECSYSYPHTNTRTSFVFSSNTTTGWLTDWPCTYRWQVASTKPFKSSRTLLVLPFVKPMQHAYKQRDVWLVSQSKQS